jgi:hypothetical protein
MKKLAVLLFFCGWFTLHAWSSPTDSISTVYRDGEFVSYCQVGVNASDSISNVVISKFTHQMCYDLDGLFTWGLKGMRLDDGKAELLLFDFKNTVYNRKTGVLRGIGDVIVPGVTTIPNLYIDSKLSLKTHPNGRRDVRLDLYSANTFLKKMVGVCSYIPKGKNKTAYYVLETHISFGWFFDMFVTQKKYKRILEWRLRQLIHNVKEESEKRERMTPNP